MPEQSKIVPPCGHGGGLRYDVKPGREAHASGKFGRMFPDLPALHEDLGISTTELNGKVAQLAEGMVDLNPDPDPFPSPRDNPAIPAGFTYLGQFIDHDITFDPTSIGDLIVDPQGTDNFRTPALELDSLYRSGPAVDRYMFDKADTDKFWLGLTRVGGGNNTILANFPNDLPRLFRPKVNPGGDPTVVMSGEAIIGDPRNDENLVVAQTHVAFLKFHNKVVDALRLRGGDAGFAKARREVVWHYQTLVLEDFVARLCAPGVLEDVIDNGRRFYKVNKGEWPFIPVEFSVAAYRLGHSMVREVYDYNRVFGFGPGAVTPATFDLLFAFTDLSGKDMPPPPVPPHEMPLPSDWIIDWRRFYDVDPANPPTNPTRALDPLLVPALHGLPGSGTQPPRLAERNLKRATMMGLPSGQRVASAMSLPALAQAKLESGTDGQALRDAGLSEHTPLWYYILKEAEQEAAGKTLGPVGSRIVAEVFVGLLQEDKASVFNKGRDEGWRPTMFADGAPRDTYTMADLIRFMGDVNPIGD